MTLRTWGQKIKNNKTRIILIMAIVLLLTLGLNLILPLKYQAATRLLIIQKMAANQDPYQSFRSAESIAHNLSKIIYTDSFYQKVTSANNVVAAQFPQDQKKRRGAWGKDVQVKTLPQINMIQVDCFHQNKQVAETILTTISQVLMTQGNEYLGINPLSLEIKQVDEILVSRFPRKPDFAQNMALALIFGFVLANIIILPQKNDLTKNWSNVKMNNSLNIYNDYNDQIKQTNGRPVNRTSQSNPYLGY